MSIFKKESETKRVIFNIDLDLAERLEKAKLESRDLGKKLDADTAVNSALEKFLKKAEKKIDELKGKKSTKRKKLTLESPFAPEQKDNNIVSDDFLDSNID